MTLLAHLQLDAPVLRHAALGDVQLRHDLEARDQRRLELHRRLHHFLQRAVDAVADADLVLEALEVDVRRAALHRVGEDGVDQLDDRRVFHLRRERRRARLPLRVSSTTSTSPSSSMLVDDVHAATPICASSSRRRCFSISVARA